MTNHDFKPTAAMFSLLVGKTVSIKYIDKSGNETERQVTIRRLYSEHGNPGVIGLCHLRNDERHFLLSRIISCHSPDIGAAISTEANERAIKLMKEYSSAKQSLACGIIFIIVIASVFLCAVGNKKAKGFAGLSLLTGLAGCLWVYSANDARKSIRMQMDAIGIS